MQARFTIGTPASGPPAETDGRPVILVVDDEALVLGRLAGDLEGPMRLAR